MVHVLAVYSWTSLADQGLCLGTPLAHVAAGLDLLPAARACGATKC